jgi:hypothetical protein
VLCWTVLCRAVLGGWLHLAALPLKSGMRSATLPADLSLLSVMKGPCDMSMRSVSLLKGGELKIEETEFGISNKHYSLERGSREIKAYYNKQEIAKHRLTPVNEIIDAYHVTVSFNEYRSINTFLDGKELGPKSCRSGTTHIYDFNEKWEVEVDAAHENI